ncbi:hypothetical protein Taro_053566 [Colocasia esculenta]|uniref:NAC domain-containing protein n=1 Tax=Colocasia esculenta TaxID=4460 RepID=A0A843XMZ4_COLES|nr:hypothetical protein [Colocasia esculenta]
MEESLPPGFRFHPSDEELITYYLAHKLSDFGFSSKAMADVDLNKCEPWDLPAKASMGEKEWYFFSLRDRKYPTGLRTNRATDAGYWKTTGKDKEIFHCGVLVGMKKTLVFYRGRAPKGEKTNWVMHEYRHQNKFAFNPTKEEWVVCRVFRKTPFAKKPQPTGPSMPPLMDSPCNTTSISELRDMDMSILNNIVDSSPILNGTSTNDNSFPTVDDINTVAKNDNRMDMNTYMNWILNREVISQSALPSWPPGLPGSSLSAVPLLKALQLNGYTPWEAPNVPSFSSLAYPQKDSAFGSESNMTNIPSSSSKGVDFGQQPAFDQETMWKSY